ncbi:MAG TPA: NAD(+) synthase [Clostridia bacterium]|nr:NAD(+) synthase [Clostridia bacterium]
MDPKKEVEKIVDWLITKVNNAGAKGLVFGLSGGIDSCLLAALCQKAYPQNILGIIMPCHSNPQDREDALLMAETFSIPVKEVDLSPVYDQLLNQLSVAPEERNSKELALANIKPRLRMNVLYYYASINSYLVAGAENRSELYIGYFTKYGDGGADLFPIAHLVKTQVKEIARYLGIPQEIINKPPSAGLWPGQTDEKELGFTYEELDNYILTGKGDEKAKEKIMKMHRNSEHKRKMPEKIVE